MKSEFNRFLSLALVLIMVISMLPVSAFAADEDVTPVLDSAWEVENQNENLVLNADGSITITTEQGTIGGTAMQNVLYQKLPNSTDYDFTVKVSGDFTANYHGAYLMITSGKELENAVGVVRRYHGYLGGNYGTNLLMGVMQDGTPAEYYEGAADIGNEFYLKLQKQNGRITGFYAAEYSDNDEDWNQIIDGDYQYVDKGSALISPDEIYVAIGAASGGTDSATDITFSDLRIGGYPVSFAVDPTTLDTVALSGDTQIDVGETMQLVATAADYNGNPIETLDSVTYTSSDESVAAVDENGVVTGVNNGMATLTAEVTVGEATRTASLNIQVGQIGVEESWTVTSPDGETKITVERVTGGTIQYHTEQNGVQNIGTSPMGLVTNLGDFSKNLVVVEASAVTEVNESYSMLSGKADTYTDHCFEQTITFARKDNADVLFDVVIRAYDDGTAYKYNIRGVDGTELRISDETSGVQLPAEATVYYMNYASATWNYESRYSQTTTEGLAVGSTPSIPMLYYKDGVWTLFTEANLKGSYCGSMTRVQEDGMLDIAFAPLQERTGDVVTTLPFASPWRVAITGTPEDIVENTLTENLNDPADYETYNFNEWVEPGLSSWSWVANWGGGASDQTKASTHLNWIEFGGEIGWDYYILDENWNLGGRGNVLPGAEGMRDWWPEVKAAAEENGVKLWAWVHVSDIDTQEERDEHLAYWASEGIVGIKPDFFDGESQAIIQLYDDLYRDCAKYGLMVLVHGANKPTGEIRTWPNVYGREAIAGQEQGGITSEQYTLIPFIRAAIGPAEVTEELRSKDYNKTTMGWQVALTVLVEDGIHSMGSAPDVYRGVPEAMTYYTNFPGGWNETEFVNGEVGKYVSIARRADTDWYVSGITVDPMSMDVPLTFLDEDQAYTALLIKENDRRDIDLEIIPNITSESTIGVSMLYGGGYAIRLIPGDAIDAITEITAPAELTVEAMMTVTAEITVGPEDAEFKDVVWSSADETIATVDSNGEIRGVSAGETIVTVASAFNPAVKAEIKVTVLPPQYELMSNTWEILNPVEEDYVITAENAVTITAQNGVLGEGNADNLFVMDVPEDDEDFTITAKISGGLNANYQGGFLTVLDKDNPDGAFVAAGRRHHTYLSGSHPAIFTVMSNGGYEPFVLDENADSDLYVQIVKTGDVFTTSYSLDGETWIAFTETLTHAELAAAENLAVGFYAGCGGGETPIDVTISEFTYNGEAVLVGEPTILPAIEMEDGVLGGGAQINNAASASGGKDVGNIGGNAAGTVTHEFVSSKARNATISVYYGTWSDRSVSVTINGRVYTAACPSTGDWHQIGETPAVLEVVLDRGLNTIVFDGVNGGDAPNLDCFVITKLDPIPVVTYNVSVAETADAVVTTDVTEAEAGETVTVTVAAAEGKVVETVTVTAADGAAVEVTENADGTYTFVMPASDVTVVVTCVDAVSVIASGWSGYTTWSLTNTGVLTVSPSGQTYNGKVNMRHYWKVNGVLTLPWSDYAEQITTVVIEEGVNSVGQMAFYELPNLETVVLAESVEEIFGYAFKNDTALTVVNLENVDYIREGAFYGCTALESFELAEDVVIEDWAFSKVPGYVPAN